MRTTPGQQGRKAPEETQNACMKTTVTCVVRHLKAQLSRKSAENGVEELEAMAEAGKEKVVQTEETKHICTRQGNKQNLTL